MTDPSNTPDLDYDYLYQLSIEQLEELLRLGADTSYAQENESYVDTIVKVILQKEKDTPSGRLADVDKSWLDFKCHYNSQESEGRVLYPGEEHTSRTQINKPVPLDVNRNNHHLRHPIRYLIAATVAVILVGSLIAQAAGYNVWGSFFSWTKEQFKFEPPHTNSEITAPPLLSTRSNSEYVSLQEALDSCGTTEPFTSPLFPSGYQYESISVSEMSAYSKINATLSNGEAQIVVNIRVYSDIDAMGDLTTEKDGTPVEQLDINGVTHYIMENNGATVAVWMSDNIYTMISGDIDVTEMKNIITSSYNTERNEFK